MVGLALPLRNRNNPPVGVPPEGNEPTGHLGCLGQSESVLLRGNVRSRDQETGSLSFPGVLVAKRGHLAKVGAERALSPFTGEIWLPEPREIQVLLTAKIDVSSPVRGRR